MGASREYFLSKSVVRTSSVVVRAHCSKNMFTSLVFLTGLQGDAGATVEVPGVGVSVMLIPCLLDLVWLLLVVRHLASCWGWVERGIMRDGFGGIKCNS